MYTYVGVVPNIQPLAIFLNRICVGNKIQKHNRLDFPVHVRQLGLVWYHSVSSNVPWWELMNLHVTFLISACNNSTLHHDNALAHSLDVIQYFFNLFCFVQEHLQLSLTRLPLIFDFFQTESLWRGRNSTTNTAECNAKSSECLFKKNDIKSCFEMWKEPWNKAMPFQGKYLRLRYLNFKYNFLKYTNGYGTNLIYTTH